MHLATSKDNLHGKWNSNDYYKSGKLKENRRSSGNKSISTIPEYGKLPHVK